MGKKIYMLQSDQGLISRTHEKWAPNINGNLSKGNIQIDQFIHEKTFSISLIIREIQMGYHVIH